MNGRTPATTFIRSRKTVHSLNASKSGEHQANSIFGHALLSNALSLIPQIKLCRAEAYKFNHTLLYSLNVCP